MVREYDTFVSIISVYQSRVLLIIYARAIAHEYFTHNNIMKVILMFFAVLVSKKNSINYRQKQL